MNDIIFNAAFGDHVRQVKITEAHGNGGPKQLMIANYYYGQFVKNSDGTWRLYLNDKANTELTADDREILIDMVIEATEYD